MYFLSHLRKHLNLIDDSNRVTYAALMLFGKKPQRFSITSEVKCMQFYGTRVEKPVPSYQIFKGDVFQLVDQATNFVMSRVDTWVGSHNQTNTAAAPSRPEFPIDAVHEAICNAVAHRDYTDNGSVQVMAQLCECTPRTVIRYVNLLTENGFISHVGPDKGGYRIINWSKLDAKLK